MSSSPSLQEFDFHVRWPGVKLLTSLLKQQGPQVQQIILVSPMGEWLSFLLINLKLEALQISWQRARGAAPLFMLALYVFLAGVSRLMDLLADSREVIRNDVSTEQRWFVLFIKSNCHLNCIYLCRIWIQLNKCT